MTGLRPGTVAGRVDGAVPPQVSAPDSPQSFADTLKHASAERLASAIRGGGPPLAWRPPPASVGLVIATTRLTRVLAHRHADLTATVQAGMTLRDFTVA